MIIRIANVNDINAIINLFYELDTGAINSQPEHFQRGERTNEYLSEIINNEKSDFLVVELSSEIIGFSLLYEKKVKSLSLLVPCKYTYIQDFVIKEEYRNQGFGAKLMNESKKWATKHNSEYLRLSVLPNNKNAQRFYASHGLIEQMITMECSLRN
jgi:ribosomal protein S18 acetylase RimI-like enzyme